MISSKVLKKIKKSVFINSFKSIDLRFVCIILWDIAYILVLAGILALTSSILKATLSNISALLPKLTGLLGGISFESSGSAAQIKEISSMLKGFLMKLVLTVAATLISMITASAFLRSHLWSKITLRKINKGYLKRFFLLKIWWIPAWCLLGVLFLFLFKIDVSRWIVIIIAILYLHFTVILHSLFDKKKPVLATLKKTFSIGIKRIHLLIIPYILAIVVLSIMAAIVYPISLTSINRIPLLIIYAILFLIFAAWLRLYIFMTVKKIEKAR